MKKIIGFIVVIFFFTSCSSRLKVYNIHSLISSDKLKNNFYLKDQSKSFEILKGTWIWTNKSDSLILKFTPHYKKEYDKELSRFKNAFYDTSIINVKYVKNGVVVYDDSKEEIDGNCLRVSTFQIQTNIFYLNNLCKKGVRSTCYLTFMNGYKGLSMLSPDSIDQYVLFKKEGEYEIKIPNSIILDRVIEDGVESYY